MSTAQYRPLDIVVKQQQEEQAEQQAEEEEAKGSLNAILTGYSIYRLNGTTTTTTTTAKSMKLMNGNLSRSSSYYLAAKSTAIKRKHLAFILLISSLLFYLLWFSLAATTTQTKADLVYTDSLRNPNVVNESLVVCSEQFVDNRAYIQNQAQGAYKNLPIIYFVTPTYPRREQIPELTRLAYTLMHVPRIHWIVADDHTVCNTYLDYLLSKFGLPYTHLSSPMPDIYRKKKPMPRGVSNRRAAIQWLKQRNTSSGILYFGDDDNTYDLKLFSEIRTTRRVSMFPVGLIEQYSVSGPVVRKGKVVGFLDSWVADRHWPVDMAGFAVNLHYMSEHPNATMMYKAGYEEDFFLRSIGLKLDFIEPKGNNCTEIMVWHTQTKHKDTSVVRISSDYLDHRSNLGVLFRNLAAMGVASTSEMEGSKAIISSNGKSKRLTYFLS